MFVSSENEVVHKLGSCAEIMHNSSSGLFAVELIFIGVRCDARFLKISMQGLTVNAILVMQRIADHVALFLQNIQQTSITEITLRQ